MMAGTLLDALFDDVYSRVPRAVGVDIVGIERIKNFLERHHSSLNKILTSQEVDDVEKSPVPHRALAVYFAAKEAVFKSLGLSRLGPAGFGWIRVCPDRPIQELGGRKIRVQIDDRLYGTEPHRHQGCFVSWAEHDGFMIAAAVSYVSVPGHTSK